MTIEEFESKMKECKKLHNQQETIYNELEHATKELDLDIKDWEIRDFIADEEKEERLTVKNLKSMYDQRFIDDEEDYDDDDFDDDNDLDDEDDE